MGWWILVLQIWFGTGLFAIGYGFGANSMTESCNQLKQPNVEESQSDTKPTNHRLFM